MRIIRSSLLSLRPPVLFGLLLLLAPQARAQAVVSAATGDGITLFVKADGTLWGIGNNQDGQLGDGTRITRGAPQLVTGGVASAAAGSRHSAFVKQDGTLWTVGYGFDGQLGFGGANYQIPPAQVATGVASVAANGASTFFVKTDGTLWATGGNSAGQLGDGSTTNRLTPVQVATGVVSVHAGAGFTVFVKGDGTLWGMGDNGRGQLADGTTTNRPLPVQIATGVATASAGGRHLIFRKTDGSLWAVGANDYGQLGDGTKISRPTPVQVATGVSAIAAGGEHTLFVKSDGSLWATGNNNVGRLGDGGETIALVPVKIATGAVAVWAGTFHSLFVKQDGTLWGFGALFGELGSTSGARLPTNASQIVPAPTGMGVTVATSGGALVFTEGANAPSPVVVVDPALTIASTTPTLVSAKVTLSGSGFVYTEEELAFTPNPATMGNITGSYDRPLSTWTLRSVDGTATIAQWEAALRSITYSNVSQAPTVADRGVDFVVHNGVTTNPVVTRAVTFVAANDSPIDIFLSSAAIFPGSGINAVIGRLSTADVDGMIANYSLVAGEGSTDNAEFNISAATLRVNNPAALTRGTYSVRIQTDDTLTGGTYAKVFKLFVAAPGERAVVSLASGYYTRYVTSDGTLWGVGPAFDFLPVRIAQGVALVPQGLQHGEMYLKKDGTLWSAGGNFPGEPSLTPVPVATNVASVAVGGNVFLSFDGPPPPDNLLTMFVKKDGTLWGVGGNDHGQLGDGTTIKRLTPVQVATGVASVSAGSEHTHFVKTDGSLWAMGANSVGQLGDGTTTDRSTPVQIATGVASVSAGGGHTVFVKIDGTLWGTGANASGELGDGTTTTRTAPVQIASGVANGSAGRSHTVFVKNDGTLWSTGRNSLGQLGDGTAIDRVSPVQVATDVAFASAGLSHSTFVKSNGSIWKAGPGGTVNPQNLVPVPVTEAWIGAQASSQSAAPDRSATFAISVGGVQNPTYEWQRNGVTVATSSPLQLAGVKPADAGIYSAKISGGAAFSEPAIFGLASNTKVAGAATEIQADIFVAANGNTIDQVLLQGAAAAITADHALRQITRVSFVDLSNDIVQVEFSGPGTLSLVLDNPTGPAIAASYNQPGVVYMKGHAGIVITGATEDTNVSVFSVGRATAVNQGLFRSDVTYDGVADIAFIAIMSSNGKFGGVRTANASYFATKGLTGLYAPGVQFTGPVFIGDISASDEATPVVVVGSVADARVTGGDLLQANGHAVKVDGLAQLKFTAGSDSHGNGLAAKPNRAILQQNGVAVTSQVVTGP